MRSNVPLAWRRRLAAVAALLIWPAVAAATHGDVVLATERSAGATHVTTAASPDGRWLAVRTQRSESELGEIAIVALEGGALRSLGELRAVDEPSWDSLGRLQLRVREAQGSRVELRTFDPATGALVASERVSETGLAQGWARVVPRRSSDGREQVRIEWAARGLKLHLPAEIAAYQITATPGIVFYGQPNGAKLAVVRHDMDRGLSTTVVELEASARSWSVSSDERLLLVTESELPRRARVLDVRNGMLVDGPWPAESARWLDDGDARYVALVSRERRTLVDRVRDRTLDLGADVGEWPVIEPLPDGRFVVQSQRSIDLCDDELRTLRTLVAKAD